MYRLNEQAFFSGAEGEGAKLTGILRERKRHCRPLQGEDTRLRLTAVPVQNFGTVCLHTSRFEWFTIFYGNTYALSSIIYVFVYSRDGTPSPIGNIISENTSSP